MGAGDGLDGVAAEERVNHKRVARVMAEHGLAGIRIRRKVRTTIQEPSEQKVPDLLNRDFTAETINTRYVGDITYLPLADGSNLYLATVIDCCSRKLAGWAVADHMRTSLVEDALKVALADRGSLRGAIFHADHGAQYTSKDYAKLCAQLGVTRSHGAVGSSADNALAESFNAALKRETLAGAATYGDARNSPLVARNPPPLPKARSGASRGTLRAPDLQPVLRDFAFIVDSAIAADQVLRAAASSAPELITGVTLFDLFEGERIGAGRKSRALVEFVKRVSEISLGKAYFTNTMTLGQFILMDFLKRKTRKVS